MDTPKEILIAYYNEINQDKRLNDIKGRYNKDSILNLLENIIDQLEEEEACWPLFIIAAASFYYSHELLLLIPGAWSPNPELPRKYPRTPNPKPEL